MSRLSSEVWTDWPSQGLTTDSTATKMKHITTLGGRDMTTTAQGDDYQWVNRETASAAEAIYELLSLHKLVTEMLHRSSNGGSFADNLEGLLWLMWDGKTPSGEDMRAIDWTQIANRIIDDNEISWEDFTKSLDK